MAVVITLLGGTWQGNKDADDALPCLLLADHAGFVSLLKIDDSCVACWGWPLPPEAGG